MHGPQKNGADATLRCSNLVRVVGVEPTRITPLEPKGDVTLVKSIVMKETYSNGIMELGTAHIPAALMKYVEKNRYQPYQVPLQTYQLAQTQR